MFSNLLNNIDNMCCDINNKLTFSKIRSNKKLSLVEVDRCRNSECLYDQFKLRKNPAKNKNLFKMNNELMIFRYNLISKIFKQKIKVTHNLSYNQLKVLKRFKSINPFEVVELDKNVGAVFMSKQVYIQFANELLADTNTYNKLEYNPFDEVLDKIKKTLDFLRVKKYISKRLFNNLTPKNSKIGSFRILPKVHKDKFACRPIVNCKNHPTSNLALFLDIILREFVENSSSFIKDSQDLMIKCTQVMLPDKCNMYSCDFESLYTNIDSQKCINLIMDFLNTKNHYSIHYNSIALKTVLDLVLYNNIFTFNNEYYVQIRGISMGIICGPTLANMYLSILEEQFLTIEKPLIYYRYIDDIFIISKTILTDIMFVKYFQNLKLNFVRDNVVNFLDLYIKYDYITNSLEFNLYVKPTSTNSYLSTCSNHPKHIIKNIPKAQFLRIRRICTSYIDYVHHSRNLIFQFVKKGYNYNILRKMANVVGGIDRNSLLKYKMKNKENINNSYSYVCKKFDTLSMNFDSTVYSTWKESNDVDDMFKFKLISTIYQNVKNTLLFKSKPDIFNFKTNYRCSNNTCKVCYRLITRKYHLIKNQLLLPIMDKCSCDAKNIVYMIICKKCHEIYVGESGRTAKVRFYEHLNNIDNFQRFGNKQTEISIHFNRPNHDLDKDMAFAILKKDIIDTYKRKNLESDLINVFKSLNLKILNDIQPNKENVKHLFFTSI
jgi:hypothetical protein